MKLLLTSFGLSHAQWRSAENPDLFYRMPPVSMSRATHAFSPDYAVLLLADTIILDKATYERLLANHHHSYAHVATMLRALHDEGFVTLEDFDTAIEPHRKLLDEALQRDLKQLDTWIVPLKESARQWQEFVLRLGESLRDEIYRARHGVIADNFFTLEPARSSQMAAWLHDANGYCTVGLGTSQLMVQQAMESARMRRKAEYRDQLRFHLAGCLAYVNANILLSHKFDAGLHDWPDFQPFYNAKFLTIARDSAPGQHEINNIRKLFELSFPELAFQQPEELIKALKDKRIASLRDLVSSACKGEVEFDREFANRVLYEVFKVEQRMSMVRKVVSYATLPLHFVPFVGVPLQKVAEEAIEHAVEHKKKKDLRWFYMISELAQRQK